MATFEFFPLMNPFFFLNFSSLRCVMGLAIWALALSAAWAQDEPGTPTLPLTWSAQPPELLDKVVAVAGQDLITLRDIDEELRLTYLEIGAEQPARFPRAFFERRRDELIERRLLFRHSESLVRMDIPEGVPTLTPEMHSEVQARVAQTVAIMRSNFENEAAFLAELRRWNLNFDTLYQRMLKNEEQTLVISMALGRLIQLPADEVNAYKAELQANNQSLNRYRLQYILITYPENASPRDQNLAHSKALDIGLRVRHKDISFEDAAKQYSQAPSAKDGGNLGFVESRDLAEPIRQALQYTRPGEITMPVEMNNGYHLFKVLEMEDARDFLWQKKFREMRNVTMQELLKTQRVEKFEF